MGKVVARRKESRGAFEVLMANLKETDLKGNLGVDWRCVLDYIFKKYGRIRGLGVMRLRLWRIRGSLCMRHCCWFHEPQY